MNLVLDTFTIGTFSDVRCQTQDWWRGFCAIETVYPQFQHLFYVPRDFVIFSGCLDWVLHFDSTRYVRVSPEILVAVKYDYRDLMLGFTDGIALLQRYVPGFRKPSNLYSYLRDLERSELTSSRRS